jgi:hypothetical protein
MEQKTHTPGPWRAAPQPGQTVGVHTFTHCVMWGDDVLADTLTEPDARLMAAAPELLAACREAFERLERMTYSTVTVRDHLMDVRDLMERAIAKAEGKKA